MYRVIKKYSRTWWLTASNALQETFINRSVNAMFFLGKAIRFVIATVFLLLLRANIKELGGYSADAMIVFYVTYQLVDTAAQVFYRGVYEFGGAIRNGSFDGTLTKPINALFNVMTGMPDINDAIFLVVATGVSIYLVASAQVTITITSFLLYLFLLGISFVIATGIHIFILCITLLTTDSNNMIFMYRDVSKLGQFPVTIYYELIRLGLFFAVPIGLMVTIPAQVLLNLQPTYSILFTTVFGISFFFASLKNWNWALKRYSSASS